MIDSGHAAEVPGVAASRLDVQFDGIFDIFQRAVDAGIFDDAAVFVASGYAADIFAAGDLAAVDQQRPVGAVLVAGCGNHAGVAAGDAADIAVARNGRRAVVDNAFHLGFGLIFPY